MFHTFNWISSNGGAAQRASAHGIKQQGFTFIEVMIVVAIIGIISAIAYPSYQSHVYKTRRADGHLALMNASQSVDQCQSENFTYSNCTLPDYLKTSDEGFYSIVLEATNDSFTLTATPQAAQSTDALCPTITLNNQGRRGFTGSGPCW